MEYLIKPYCDFEMLTSVDPIQNRACFLSISFIFTLFLWLILSPFFYFLLFSLHFLITPSLYHNSSFTTSISFPLFTILSSLSIFFVFLKILCKSFNAQQYMYKYLAVYCIDKKDCILPYTRFQTNAATLLSKQGIPIQKHPCNRASNSQGCYELCAITKVILMAAMRVVYGRLPSFGPYVVHSTSIYLPQ